MGETAKSTRLTKFCIWILDFEALLLQILLAGIIILLWTQRFGANTSNFHPYFLLVCIGLSGPYFCGKVVGPMWNKITPIKDRPTHFESYICYLISVLISIFMSFVILGLTDVLNALRFGLKTTLIILPFTLIFWSLKLRFHTPSSDPVELTDEETHHSEDEAKPSNYIAYIASATASAFVFNLILFPILVMRGGIELISILLPTFIPLAIFNACLAPVFIQIGDKLWTKSESVALKYVWGATLGLFVLMVSSVCRPAIEMSLEGILSQWSIFLVFAIAIISYMAGGLVLAKTYRTSSPESLFS